MANSENVVKIMRSRAKHSRTIYYINVLLMLYLVTFLTWIYLTSSAGEFLRIPESSQAMYYTFIGGAIVRVGVVAIGIYGVQIMFSFARYHIRLANHLEASADALQLCENNYSELGVIQQVMVPTGIDFGKTPASPSDKLVELVQELVKKLPTQGK